MEEKIMKKKNFFTCDLLTLTEGDIENYRLKLSTLLTISKITHYELGLLIGVTRSQISNICGKNGKMNKTQYLAINTALDRYLGHDKYTKMLLIANDLYEEA